MNLSNWAQTVPGHMNAYQRASPGEETLDNNQVNKSICSVDVI